MIKTGLLNVLICTEILICVCEYILNPCSDGAATWMCLCGYGK